MAATGFDLLSILGHVSLLKQVEEIRNGIPDPLPKEFASTTEDVIGDSGRYISTIGTRLTSRLVQYGAPSYNRALSDVGDRGVKLLHSYEDIRLKPLLLQQLRNYDNYDIQRLGMQELARQVKNFVTKFENTRIASKEMMLATGVLYADGNGNFLPTSSGAVETISCGMNATTNQGACTDTAGVNIFGATGGGSWKSQTTDIPLQLRRLKKTAKTRTGYPLKYAIYGINIPDYLTQNDFVENYLARNEKMRDHYMETNELPDGLLGYTWIPAYEAFWNSGTDTVPTNNSIFPDDQVTFTPAVTNEWWTVFQGSYMVPTSIDIAATAEAAMANLKQVWGMGAYAQVINNPVTIGMWMFDTQLPVVKVPDSVFQATVV